MLVSGNESSLFSTHTVVNSADTLQFGDVFKIAVDEDRLYSCSIQLQVVCVTEIRDHCLVSDVYLSVACYTSIVFWIRN